MFNFNPLTRYKTLPNLNSLRFIAAALVSTSHVNTTLQWNGYKGSDSFIFKLGLISVVFFFVLSGYLITHLLLIENKSQRISIKKFYIKRALRIWPLYFLLVILSFGILNNSNFFNWHFKFDVFGMAKHPYISSILILLISPNVLLLFVKSIGYIGHTWSIGVEEQFYLIWPWIMRSKKPVLYILIIIISVYLISNNCISLFLSSVHIPLKPYLVLKYISDFFTVFFSFKIDALAIGALGAFIANKKPAILTIIFSRQFQYFLYFILLILLVYPMMVNYQFYSLIFIMVILNFAINRNSIFNLEFRPLSYLGKISYGIYMFHVIPIVPSAKLVYGVFNMTPNLLSELLICMLSLLITILISAISYTYFESHFLRLKVRLIKES